MTVGRNRVYGRKRVIELVRRLMMREKRGRSLRNQRFPILVVEGSRGAGKTALLSELVDLLDQRVPHARLDFDTNRHASVPQVLSALAFDLSRKCQMGDLMVFPTTQFTGTGVPTEGVDPQLFAPVRANICAAAGHGLQAVLYAAREIDLGAFLESLEDRPCPTPLTILTAGLDLGEILEGREQAMRAANLRVVVASTVDAEGWAQNVEGTPEHYDEFLSAFQKEGFDPGHLDGANAIMMHDALLAAAQAVRLAAPKGSESSPVADGVRAQLLNLNGLYAVPGASGTLSFSGSSSGNPAGKPVPVLQYPRPSVSPSRQVGPLYYVED